MTFRTALAWTGSAAGEEEYSTSARCITESPGTDSPNMQVACNWVAWPLQGCQLQGGVARGGGIGRAEGSPRPADGAARGSSPAALPAATAVRAVLPARAVACLHTAACELCISFVYTQLIWWNKACV